MARTRRRRRTARIASPRSTQRAKAARIDSFKRWCWKIRRASTTTLWNTKSAWELCRASARSTWTRANGPHWRVCLSIRAIRRRRWRHSQSRAAAQSVSWPCSIRSHPAPNTNRRLASLSLAAPSRATRAHRCVTRRSLSPHPRPPPPPPRILPRLRRLAAQGHSQAATRRLSPRLIPTRALALPRVAARFAADWSRHFPCQPRPSLRRATHPSAEWIHATLASQICLTPRQRQLRIATTMQLQLQQ